LESRKNGNRCVSSKFESLAFDRKYKGADYRSDDAGEHWELINEDKNLLAKTMVLHEFTNRSKKRKWINRINVDAWKTSDGGKSFKKNKCWTWRYT
jgi:photosystem II stability/assembly factor-like uncharacterized protein